MDKRDLAAVFQTRLKTLVERDEASQTSFAASVGIDRSALSQLLGGRTARLPRVETLLNIAEKHSVSLDWLLGLSQDEGITGALRNSFEIEDENEGADSRSLLEKWHAEATGTKIRYVPLRLPDLFRIKPVIAYETALLQQTKMTAIPETLFRLDYNRQPGTDMEVCMPLQTLEAFSKGQGIWKDLSISHRRAQIDHIVALLDELYPSFRLYLFDEGQSFSAPYTVFGPYRVAIYVGDMYLVLNSKEAVLSMQRHFDSLIRSAVVNAHETASHVARLIVV